MMKRLTFEGNFCEIARCGYPTCPYKDGCSQKQVWERLKQYEDTGLSPIACEESAKIEKGLSKGGYSTSRMVELMCADKEGRVIVLPCKVGDILWITGSIRRLYSAKVRTFFIGHPSGVRGGDNDGGTQMIRTTECDVPMRDFGKTVFLTREEAEKALAEMEGKKDG